MRGIAHADWKAGLRVALIRSKCTTLADNQSRKTWLWDTKKYLGVPIGVEMTPPWDSVDPFERQPFPILESAYSSKSYTIRDTWNTRSIGNALLGQTFKPNTLQQQQRSHYLAICLLTLLKHPQILDWRHQRDTSMPISIRISLWTQLNVHEFV